MELRELTWHERGRLWLRLGIRLILTALVILLLVSVGPFLLSLFMPFVLAIVMAWILNPLIKLIQRRAGVPRNVLSLLLLVLLLAVVGGALFALGYNMAMEIKALLSNWEASSAFSPSSLTPCPTSSAWWPTRRWISW